MGRFIVTDSPFAGPWGAGGPWRTAGFSLVAGLLLLAGCAGSIGESTEARRAERLNAAKNLGRELVDTGRYEEALGVLEPLGREASGDEQIFVMLGEAYQGLDRVADAVASYETAIRLAYRDYLAHLKLANLLMKTGKTGRALTEFELAAEFGDGDPVTHYDYGLALYQMGRGERALEEWKSAWRLDPNSPVYAEAVGIGLTEGNPAEAVKFFENSGRLGADDASFHNNFALALQRTGDRRRAAGEFARAVERRPGSEAYRFNLAAAYMNMGAYREALAQWDTLAARFGPRWSYSVYRGRALLEQGRYRDAISAVESIAEQYESGALERDGDRLDRTPPRLGEALEVLAMAWRSLDEHGRALEYIRRAVELEPRNVSFLNNYGVILAEGGNIDLATAQWKKVLEIDADDATARRNLSVLEP